MKKIIGKKYEYLIETDNSIGCFEIISKHIETNRVSTITNLNFLISELSSCYDQNDEIDETTWIIKDNRRLKRLKKLVYNNFNDPSFLVYLEQQLDIDRNIGGWNSEYSF